MLRGTVDTKYIVRSIRSPIIVSRTQVGVWLPGVPKLPSPKIRKVVRKCPCGVARCKHGGSCRILLEVPRTVVRYRNTRIF